MHKPSNVPHSTKDSSHFSSDMLPIKNNTKTNKTVKYPLWLWWQLWCFTWNKLSVTSLYNRHQYYLNLSFAASSLSSFLRTNHYSPSVAKDAPTLSLCISTFHRFLHEVWFIAYNQLVLVLRKQNWAWLLFLLWSPFCLSVKSPLH